MRPAERGYDVIIRHYFMTQDAQVWDRVSAALRARASRIRTAADGLLAPGRRRRALGRLHRLGRPQGVVFVCLGNICRSAYAEAALRTRLLERGVSGPAVSSAGLIGPGRPAPTVAQEVAHERGVDLSHHRSRLLEEVSLSATDLILTMSPDQSADVRRRGSGGAPILVMGDLDPARGHRRGIRDPYGRDEVVFRAVYDRIDRCLEQLIALWSDPTGK